ncbi:MAG: FmdE family protein [Anaerolineales bacterium]
MKSIEALLEKSASQHNHLCPRQILGVRIGLAGMTALGLEISRADNKRLLVIVESDGCFADGISAATDCTVGHRTLRVEDYGKIAATFGDVQKGRTVRIAPALDVRQRAYAWVPDEARHYFVQMQAYQVMPDNELLTVTEVQLTTPLSHIISRPGLRMECAKCGEEIINERETIINGQPYCESCAHGGYYRLIPEMKLLSVENLHNKHTAALN